MIPYAKVYLKDLRASAESDQLEHKDILHQILTLQPKIYTNRSIIKFQ